MSDLSPKERKIAVLEERIKALESQMESEEKPSEKVIPFPKLPKRQKSS